MNVSQMVFVFGSNLSGIHGAGAAKVAHQRRKAPWGMGEGFFDHSPNNKTYALPTKGKNITFMTLAEVKEHVEKFIGFAMSHPLLKFQVTQVGCGLGGFTKEDIAPLFRDAPINCFFDEAWEELLGDEFEYWGTYP